MIETLTLQTWFDGGWQLIDAADLSANIRNEIEASEIDAQQICDDEFRFYTASDGRDYRWLNPNLYA